MIKYYHLSRTELEIGKTISFPFRVLINSEIDDLLDDARPEGTPRRGECIYMVDNENIGKNIGVTFDSGFIYEVIPDGTIVKADMSWIGQIQLKGKTDDISRLLQLPESTLFSKLELSKNYWAEELSSKPVWEYLATSATPCKLIKPWSRYPAIIKNTP